MDNLNPIGTVVTNISTGRSPFLLIEFQSYANTVVYPSYTKVIFYSSGHYVLGGGTIQLLQPSTLELN